MSLQCQSIDGNQAAARHSNRPAPNEPGINTENPQKIFQCHAYECGFRSNLLTLMHGFLTSTKPTSGKLKGDEFQRVKKVLAGINQPPVSRKALAAGSSKSPPPSTPPPTKSPPPANKPLIDSPEERVRELHNIDEKLNRDVATMNPAAAGYIRRHACLSSESMTKWRCGYLPNDGGGDKRGWSLRGSILYPVLSEQGKVLAWAGRDVQFEQKEKEYQQLSPAERSGKEPPAKHRFPKGFHRGIELSSPGLIMCFWQLVFRRTKPLLWRRLQIPGFEQSGISEALLDLRSLKPDSAWGVRLVSDA